MVGGLVLVPVMGQAQEALRGAISGDRAVQYRPPAPVREREGLRVGPVQFNVSASLRSEYNSNIRVQYTEQEMDDFIFTPTVDIGALWPITEASSLALGVGVGYAAYVDHSEYNYLIINPDSALAYSVRIKDVVLSAYNIIEYTGDVLSQPDLSGIARYPRLDETVGIRALGTFGNWQVSGGGAYNIFKAFDDDYRYMDRGTAQFFARGAYLFGQRTRVGVEGSASFSDYWEDLRSNFQSYSFGPFATWAVNEDLSLDARGGYVMYVYEETSGLPTPDDLSSYYVGLTASHNLTDYITHRLSALRDVRVGYNVGADYLEQFNLTYSITWRMMDPVDLYAGANYSWGEESQTHGLGGEQFDRVGANVGATCRITDHLTARLDYRYYTRNSDVAYRDYDNHTVGLTVSYRF